MIVTAEVILGHEYFTPDAEIDKAQMCTLKGEVKPDPVIGLDAEVYGCHNGERELIAHVKQDYMSILRAKLRSQHIADSLHGREGDVA